MDNNENKSIWNKVLYKGMNGRDVTVGKFIIGIILLVGGTFLAFQIAGGVID